MRLLLADPPVASRAAPGSRLDLDDLAAAYAMPGPTGAWLRVNMVSTLDGAGTGADGRTGSINTEADHVVFELLRAVSDVVVIGAGTARTEGYSPLRLPGPYAALRDSAGRGTSLPLAVVTRSGALPLLLRRQSDTSPVLAVTAARSPGLPGLRDVLGADQVLVAGEDDVDLATAVGLLQRLGLRHVHCEGGAHVLSQLLAADLVDELDVTYSPVVVGGSHGRIVAGPPMERSFLPRLLVEADGTVMGRWLRDAPP
jgi:riboflavin biosynthesis pyrimidine reductase